MKFGKILNQKLTTEWRTQYFDYDEAKAMLKAFAKSVRKDSAADDSDSDDIETQTNTFENDFFDFTERQLQKANDFLREKAGEAKQKVAQVRANLNEFLEHKKILEREKEKRDTERPSRPSILSAYGSLEREHRRHTSLNLHDFELAFSELYLGLILLQNYQRLNLTAFRKILKKHDKMLSTNRGVRWREEVVLTSLFATCKDVDQMLSEVEHEVTEKLAAGDRKKAMKRLRVPPLGQPHHSAWTILRIGIWAGALIILSILVAVAVPYSLCDPLAPGCWQDSCTPRNFSDPLAFDEPKFWEITIRIYRGIFLFSLMIILLGINVQGWAASGINHVLIFELDPRDHLSSFHLIEVGIALTTISSLSLVFWLMQFYIDCVFDIDPLIIRYAALAYLLLLILFLLNPLPIFMYRSRVWLLKVLFRIVTAPFFEVRFADFWLADQFTSLVPVFQDCVFIICCCSLQFLPNDVEKTCDRKLFAVTNIIGCLPAWFRFVQCLRRYYDSGMKHPHLTNAGKYSTTFFVVLFRSLHSAWDNGMIGPGTRTTTMVPSTEMPIANTTAVPTTITAATTFFPFIFDPDNPFLYCWIVAAAIGTLYTYFWDVRMDWGLLNCGITGKNRCLRSYIIFQHRWYYYVAIASNLILRLSWTITIVDIQISDTTYITDTFVTSLTFIEMFRRFVWNFFRLENEHVNNTGEFRAIRDIAIKPIHADEEEMLLKQRRREQRKTLSTPKDLLIPKKSYYLNRFTRAFRNMWNRLTGGRSDGFQIPAVAYESYTSRTSLVDHHEDNSSIDMEAPQANRGLDTDALSIQLLESFYVTRRSRRESVVNPNRE